MPKILIVDDEPRIREMLEETLEELTDQGVELIVAANGMEALEAIRHQKPELAFMDVLMPKMNGLEVCNAVKKQLGMEGIHIVMLTTQGQEFENTRLTEAGADSILPKPLDPNEVFDKAIRVLGLSG